MQIIVFIILNFLKLLQSNFDEKFFLSKRFFGGDFESSETFFQPVIGIDF